jgi:hypothetical protein
VPYTTTNVNYKFHVTYIFVAADFEANLITANSEYIRDYVALPVVITSNKMRYITRREGTQLRSYTRKVT